MTNISIVTPAYNYGRFIDDCLHSVANQELRAAEHLLIDNGSTDDTYDRITASDAPTRVIRQEHTGLAITLERLLANATGDWIGWQNADDFYLPHAFESLSAALDRHPDADIVVGDTLFMDESANALRLLASHRVSKPVALHYEMVPYAPCSYFFRRELASEVGIRADTRFLMDKWLLLDMLARGARTAWLNVPIGAMRRHSNQVSATYGGDAGDAERREFRERNDLPTDGLRKSLSQLYGRFEHIQLKVRDGAYIREHNWRKYRGEDCRWWTSEDHWLRGVITTPT